MNDEGLKRKYKKDLECYVVRCYKAAGSPHPRQVRPLSTA